MNEAETNAKLFDLNLNVSDNLLERNSTKQRDSEAYKPLKNIKKFNHI